jgi:putative heme iron utilization protein
MERLTSDAAAAICTHMNDDHADAIAGYARTFGGLVDVAEARIARLDADGMDLEVQTPAGTQLTHIAFDHVLVDGADARATLIAMARAT